ncbi:hypothetical protein M0G43_13490 [Subsaxibacter sp. CAU 1640]|uniref:sporulation-delaying protein SdpB family protein n=1 Tax=Subsaxibacter sp. CAU 1640 TaxID=2933271 RepID=UPI0020039469|nr:sporulation-delaying protein SdpB family protein [Subsaxibacter sp. CAU 1640]MCK7591595.1 hypothetical protein [Subsaxibacter sp. CAU 1640]
MINDLIKSLTKFSAYNSHTNVYGFARSFFALSTLLTFLINPNNVLFPETDGATSYDMVYTSIFKEINLFIILGEHMILAKLIAIVILVLVLIGIYPRYTVILHWWVASSFLLLSPAVEGGDQLIAIMTLLFIPIGLTDGRKWHWSVSDQQIKNPHVRFVVNSFYIVARIQMFILYLQAAIGKLAVDEWTNGTVLYYWFEDNIFGLNENFKSVFLPLMSNFYVVSLLTYSVLLLEFALALAFVMDEKKRKIFLYLGVFFHFCIWFVHGLPTFFITMTGALILYIIPFYRHIDTDRLAKLFTRKPKKQYV